MKKLLILALFISCMGHAAIQKKLSDNLARSRSEVMELGARLASLEKEIGSKNNLYLTSTEQITQFEADVSLYRDRLREIHAQVKESQLENKKILQSYLIESENEGTEEWQKKVHLELFKQSQAKLKLKEEELVSFELKVAEFDAKLVGLKSTEEELAEVIKELEVRKKIAMDLYMAKVQDKKVAESQVQKTKLTEKIAVVKKEFSQAAIIETKPDRFFRKPVDDYMTYTPSPKGVTFKYQSIQPVKAVGGGKVVFAGDLASYGQVVLIDHGNDLRTVLLGKMDIKVKKNDTVSDGDVLAYTQGSKDDAQNLYFEVRKKNTAQNTILWLDLNGVSKI